MVDENLAPEEREAVIALLRQTIASDRYPLSPRIRVLKAALAKLDPAAVPPKPVDPIPPPKGWVNSSISRKKRRR